MGLAGRPACSSHHQIVFLDLLLILRQVVVFSPAMASIALLLYLIIATFSIAGAVKVSPPSLHQEGGNLTEAEPNVRSVSWFPAASFTDPCNATEPPASAVIGPPGDMVCEGAEPGERICVCVTNIGPPGSGYHRHCGTCHDPCALHFHMEEPNEDFVAFMS